MIVKLRKFSENDLERLVLLANNPKIANNLTDKFPYPYTEEAGKWFINFALEHPGHNIFAIEVDGEYAGSIGIHPLDDVFKLSAEIGYWVGEEYWGKGVATEAVRQIVEFGFQNLEINRIFARPYVTNKASQRVLEKSGFKLEARFEKTIIKNGIIQDELVYAVRRM
ncbi:MAG: GNAT family N-acetyltransferase [Flavobacteriales bacterium]|nr:GNAT family N-acetyltransferase [Flavobacteriales bacterium]